MIFAAAFTPNVALKIVEMEYSRCSRKAKSPSSCYLIGNTVVTN